ncbi:MAG: DinB family protein [Gemmatimonadaceae bacterium]|nr:DinB family protein [Gemmatimonadaceae bacterium]
MADDTPEAVRLASTISHAMSGTPWHGTALRPLLADVRAADAARTVMPGTHSIWAIVLHLTAWCREVTRRVRTGEAQDPVDGDWPPVPAVPTPEAWTAACEALQAAHDELAALLASSPDAVMRRRVGDVRDAALGTGLSVRATVLGVAQHAAYHGGQIALLKKVLHASAPTPP